ncbi:MAG: hypothetical protein Q4C95_08450 [Planctomycetia bacterium]|nr:hypothetical protein [Planctomycetia bacterium]
MKKASKYQRRFLLFFWGFLILLFVSGRAIAQKEKECLEYFADFAKLEIGFQGDSTLYTLPDLKVCGSSNSTFGLITEEGTLIEAKKIAPESNESIKVYFNDDSVALYQIECGQGFFLFKLVSLETKQPIKQCILFQMNVPQEATFASLINHVSWEGEKIGLVTASINVLPFGIPTNETSTFGTPEEYRENVPCRTLKVCSYAKHDLSPSAFGLVVCPETAWPEVMQQFQKAADLPSPKPGGKWRNNSDWVKESYFFLTYFNEKEYETALKFAQRGGFKQILLLQNSWATTTGHYEINRNSFPEGIDGLRKIIERFQGEGIRFGLHLLAASVDASDSYLTPVPDDRFVLGVQTELADDISAEDSFLPTFEAPVNFPYQEESYYMGMGQTLRIDDELITYEKIQPESDQAGTSDAAPIGFDGCQRGYLGTVASSHKKGTPIWHFMRAYGYHLYDLDSTLLDEIASNFANVVNQLPIDMIYFDGSELLQHREDHWFYNAKLHRAIYDKIDNKDILYQASSCSPYSWNLLSRMASADGHDDLKAYLEERSPGFLSRNNDVMPLDIGWYYGYDQRATPDMYEYVLGATIGYDSSMSFQASVDAALKHPFIGEILDMIARYEQLRLSGRVPEEMRKRLQINPALGGSKSEEERNALLSLRRDYRLVEENGNDYFQRIIYPLWQHITPTDPTSREWELTVEETSRIGFQIQFKGEGETGDQKLVRPRLEIDGQTLEMPLILSRGQYGFAFPGEKITQYGLPLQESNSIAETGKELTLQPGTYAVRFSCEEGENLPIRIRTPLQPDERYEIPK